MSKFMGSRLNAGVLPEVVGDGNTQAALADSADIADAYTCVTVTLASRLKEMLMS